MKNRLGGIILTLAATVVVWVGATPVGAEQRRRATSVTARAVTSPPTVAVVYCGLPCPPVTAYPHDFYVVGRVRGTPEECVFRRRVVLHRTTPGGTSAIAETTTRRNGRYLFVLSRYAFHHGEYFVRAAPIDSDDTSSESCGGSRSRSVRFPGEIEGARPA